MNEINQSELLELDELISSYESDLLREDTLLPTDTFLDQLSSDSLMNGFSLDFAESSKLLSAEKDSTSVSVTASAPASNLTLSLQPLPPPPPPPPPAPPQPKSTAKRKTETGPQQVPLIINQQPIQSLVIPQVIYTSSDGAALPQTQSLLLHVNYIKSEPATLIYNGNCTGSSVGIGSTILAAQPAATLLTANIPFMFDSDKLPISKVNANGIGRSSNATVNKPRP